MVQRHPSSREPDSSVVDEALAALGAEELRELLRDIIPWLDEKSHARFVNTLIDRAASTRSGWIPKRPADERVSEILAFAEAAKRSGYADAPEVDDCLREGSNAFLAKDYEAACQIFRALLRPLGEGEIDLGQDEMVDEVLGMDVAACAAQHIVATYMTSVPADRAGAVRSAIENVREVGHFWEPLGEMERVAVEPLPDLDNFLSQWRGLIENDVGPARKEDWDTDFDQWRREVVRRMEGAEGLAKVARSTKRGDDLRAWWLLRRTSVKSDQQ